MAHYAFINSEGIVTEVIVGRDESEGDWETYYAKIRNQQCVRTSYNGNIRRRFAGVGFTYDAENDVFIEPQPFPSWVLDNNFDWQAPIPRPNGDQWIWDEETTSWVQQ